MCVQAQPYQNVKSDRKKRFSSYTYAYAGHSWSAKPVLDKAHVCETTKIYQSSCAQRAGSTK